MIQVEVDKAKGVLKISYAQHVGADDAKRAMEKLPGLLAGLQPGFRLLADLNALDAMDLACLPYIEQTMDLCNKKGVRLVVRVIPDPQKDIGMNILSLFHYRRQVRIVTCESLAEAMRVLAE